MLRNDDTTIRFPIQFEKDVIPAMTKKNKVDE
jgi:hypothetical protein